METIGDQLGELYGILFAEAGKQDLEIVGAAFVHYLDYDESTGFSNYRAGVMVNKMGTNSGAVNAVAYPSVEVVQAVHKGPYEEFTLSYGKMDGYIQVNGLDISGEAFEFYQVGVMQEPHSSHWETLIAFPLK
jgi:effector-binding domain-containing protein